MADLYFALYVFGYISSILGIVLIGVHCFYLINNIKSGDWIQTEGQIKDAKLLVEEGLGENNKDKIYNASIVYKYWIREKEYVSTKVFFGDVLYTANVKGKRKLLKKYSRNKKVDVYYNPSRPKEAVLEKGFRIKGLYNIFLSLVAVSLGYFLLVETDIIVDFVYQYFNVVDNPS